MPKKMGSIPPGTEGQEISFSMTDEAFYGNAGVAPPADPPGQTPAEIQAALAGEEPPAAVPPEEEDPDLDPEEEEEPEDTPTEADKEEEQEQEAEAPAPVDVYAGTDPDWDKVRQQSDQALANAKKQSDALAAKVTGLEAQLEARAIETPEEKPDESDKLMDEALEGMSALTEDSTGKEIVDAQKAFAKAVAAQKKAKPASKGESAAVKALTAQVEVLKKSIEDGQQAEKDGRQADAQKAVNAEHNAFLKSLDKRFSPKLRNLAHKAVSKRLVEEGYTRENRADALTLKMLYEDSYTKLAKKYPKKVVKGGPSGQPPRLDSGRGGAAAPKIKPGTRAEVLTQLVNKGMFKPPNR